MREKLIKINEVLNKIYLNLEKMELHANAHNLREDAIFPLHEIICSIPEIEEIKQEENNIIYFDFKGNKNEIKK